MSSSNSEINQTRSSAIYCVKPNASIQCPEGNCQQCETLQYYVDNVDTAINNQENVTLMFAFGSHKANIRGTVAITVPTLTVKGNAENAAAVSVICDCGTIWCCFFAFTGIQHVTFEHIIMVESFPFMFSYIQSLGLYNIAFINTTISIGSTKNAILENSTLEGVDSGILLSTAENAVFKKVEFYDVVVIGFTILHGRGITLNDILMHNSRLIMQNSTVVIGGNSRFINGIGNVATSFNNNITLSGNILFANNTNLDEGAFFLFGSLLNIAADANVSFINNSALSSGGGLYLDSTPFLLVTGARMTFINNSAYNKGGAIYVEPSLSTIPIVAIAVDKCFFHQLFCDNSEINIFFANNSAGNGGDDVYGASLQECLSSKTKCNQVTVGGVTSSISTVSSDPQRVCVCDNQGKPQCNDSSFINIHREVYPGESFTIPVVIVGWDFGTTVGMIYTHYIATRPSAAMIYGNHPSVQLVSDNKQCTNLYISLASNHTPASVPIYINAVHNDMVLNGYYSFVDGGINCSETDSDLPLCIHTTPIFLNVTLLPCPPGFTLLDQRCDCHLHGELFDHCIITNGTGYFSWSTSTWIEVQSNGIVYNKYCPINYCNVTGKPIDLLSDPDSQCGYNRQGVLCGGCQDNYSLALGSSQCISCPDNNNLALLLFFAAAGFLLVIFISVFNLTIAQGMINGLIFYANIVWTYRSVMLQDNDHIHIFLKVFLAWLNFDFGIETCFCRGLNAFWKTWLQYIFPFYTAGLFIIGLRYSSRLSKLFGNRSAPTLATLLFLSYAKLLRTIITSLELAPLSSFPNHSVDFVWLVDGRLGYGQFPHIFLLIAALTALLVLWVPYTMLLLLMQWLRRLPNERISKWITRYKPLFDAHFAPLKDKHHYWFGMLLLIRGILLLVSSLTANLNPTISLFLLLGIALIVLWYLNYRKIYKTKYVLLMESAFIVNLILLVSGIMYADSDKQKLVLMNISIAVAFIKFCGIILWNILWSIPRCKRKQTNNFETATEEVKTQSVQVMEQSARDDEFRDSILSEDTPLLINAENSCTY